MYRLGIDTGGTFTDAVLWEEGSGIIGTCKVPSDNANPANAVLLAAKRVCGMCDVDIHEVSDIVHGTTVATNLSLEENGPRIALLTTAGFRDVLEIARLTRPPEALYDLLDPGSKPLVARRDRFEINERIGSHGEVIEPLNRDDVKKAVEAIKSRGITSVAVSYLFSFVNPEHERCTLDIIREMAPELKVSLSSSILPQIREYERTAAAVINAYLQPECGPYLDSLKRRFREEGIGARIWVMQSNGGVAAPEYVAEYPLHLLMSGPSGGVVAVREMIQKKQLGDVISVDMGGTSFDVSCVMHGEIPLTSNGTALGMPLRVPSVDISTIGTGGGSIAYVDGAGQLHVGPKSAGALPGPACYGHGGTEPTVTDANVVIGLIPDGERLGKDVVISREAAVAACEPLANKLGMSVVDLAYGIRRISTASMAGAVREISIGKGRDPRSFSLLAFGGAGPLHAVDIAKAMGIGRVVVPRAAGVLSALGLVTSDVVRTYTRSTVGATWEDDPIRLAALALREEAGGFEEEIAGWDVKHRYLLDMRYAGQNSTISVPIDDPFSQNANDEACCSFHERHKELNSYCDESAEVKVDAVNLIVSGRFARESGCPAEPLEAANRVVPPTGSRSVWQKDGTILDLPVVDIDAVEGFGSIASPCVLSSSTTTIFVPDYADCFMDREGDVVISLKEDGDER